MKDAFAAPASFFALDSTVQESAANALPVAKTRVTARARALTGASMFKTVQLEARNRANPRPVRKSGMPSNVQRVMPKSGGIFDGMFAEIAHGTLLTVSV
jgi:hypothetical protein